MVSTRWAMGGDCKASCRRHEFFLFTRFIARGKQLKLWFFEFYQNLCGFRETLTDFCWLFRFFLNRSPESETETQLSTQKMSEKVAFVYPLIYRHCKYLCRRSTLAALYSFELQISRSADNFLNVLRTMDLQTVQFYSHFKYTAAAPQNIQFLCGSWPHQEYTSFTRWLSTSKIKFDKRTWIKCQ